MNKEILALNKGITITQDGCVIGIRGRNISYPGKDGYLHVTLRHKGKTNVVPVHRIQAYLKYGDEIYGKGIVVRHLNGDKTDNSWDNISIGTESENRMDIPEQERSRIAKIAASKNGLSYPKEKIILIKEDLANGLTYKEIMKKHNVSSKGTISYIKNKYKI